MNVKRKFLFRRFCKRCDKFYRPVGRYQVFCDECKVKTQWLKRK